MRGLLAVMTGAGLPLGLSGLLLGLGWITQERMLLLAGGLAVGSSLTLGPFGAVLGILVVRRRVSPTPVRDAMQVASILPAIATLIAVLPVSAQSFPIAILCIPLVFLPGPAAAWIAARLWQASEPK